MFKLFRRLTQCKDVAKRAMQKSEECSTAYHESLAKNTEAHCALMEKIDRRGAHRKMSAA